MKQDKFDGSFELLVQHFLNDKLFYGSWAEHVDQYFNFPNIHVIQYEELLNVNLSIIYFWLFFILFNLF